MGGKVVNCVIKIPDKKEIKSKKDRFAILFQLKIVS